MPRPPNLEARARILEAACRLFHARGYRGVSMDDVAGAAGLKKANLFHYYPTKDALGLAVLDKMTACYKEDVDRRLSGDGDPIKAVEAMFAESARSMEESRCCRGCFIGNLAQELSDQNERLRLKISAFFGYWSGRLSELLERGRARGYFRQDLDCAQSAEAILSLFEGATLLAKANKKVASLKNAGRMASSYLKGLKA